MYMCIVHVVPQTQDDLTGSTCTAHTSFNVNTPLKGHCDVIIIGLLGSSTLNPMHDILECGTINWLVEDVSKVIFNTYLVWFNNLGCHTFSHPMESLFCNVTSGIDAFWMTPRLPPYNLVGSFTGIPRE